MARKQAWRLLNSALPKLTTPRWRLYSTKLEEYRSAVSDLNSLQSNYEVVQKFNEIRDDLNARAIPEMVDWCRKIGYEPADFDRLNPVHIAGTKGKGSTSTFISSILSQYLPEKASLEAERIPSDVGLYTSPHIRFVRERIRVNGRSLSEEAFARSFYELWDRLEEPGVASVAKPSYFRYLTLMALHHFMRTGVGTAVIECGIGGEYDSTNILVRPSITGVSSLGIDHVAMLGETIESIAWHKAGIFKRGTPAFTVLQPDSALAMLKQRAKEVQTELYQVPDYSVLEEIKLGLAGDMQKTNAGLAIAISAAHLHRLGYTDMPDPLDPALKLPTKFVTGLENARLAGRCDERQDRQLADLTWFIDGGHTLQSIQMAGRWYAERASTPSSSSGLSDTKRVLVFNQQARDAPALARALFNTLSTVLKHGHPFDHVVFCTNAAYKQGRSQSDLTAIGVRQEDVESLRVQRELAQIWNSIDPVATVSVLPTIEEAIQHARSVVNNVQTHVLVTGSLHLVGGFIDVLESETEQGL